MNKEIKARKRKSGKPEGCLPGIEFLENHSFKKGVLVSLAFLGVFAIG